MLTSRWSSGVCCQCDRKIVPNISLELLCAIVGETGYGVNLYESTYSYNEKDKLSIYREFRLE